MVSKEQSVKRWSATMARVDVFKSSSNNTSVERCGRCSYFSIHLAQTFLFAANVLALAGFFDCRLVTVRGNLEAIFSNNVTFNNGDELDINVTNYDNVTAWEEMQQGNSSTLRGVGLWGWESQNGTCLCHNDATKALNLGYQNVTGDEWKEARYIMGTTIALSWPVFLWLMTFSFMTMSKMHRNVLGLVLIVVLSSAQSLIYLIFPSEFCVEFECQFGSGLTMLAISSLLTVLSGMILVLSNGERRQEREDRTLDPLGQICTLDEEERRRDGFNNAREVLVEQELIDLALVDLVKATTVTTAATSVMAAVDPQTPES